jgi:hypothetical protein
MSIVLPPLRIWVEGHLSSILKATTQANFDDAFGAFMSKNAKIIVNGRHTSYEQYREQLLAESAVNKQSASVKFDGVVEVPTDQEQPVKVYSL